MNKDISVIFLSMTLGIAFTRFTQAASLNWEAWFIFCYFVFRKITYFISDDRCVTTLPTLFKEDTLTERAFLLFFGVATFFLFMVAGYYITDTTSFFLFYALALLVNIGWLIFQIIVIDPEKDKKPSTVRAMFTHHIAINAAEILLSLTAAVWLLNKWETPQMPFAMLRPWITGLSLGCLSFIMIITVILHKQFLFE